MVFITFLGSLLKSENEAQRIEQGRFFAGKVFQAAKAVRGYLSKIQAEQKHDVKGLEDPEEQEELELDPEEQEELNEQETPQELKQLEELIELEV